MLGAAQLAPVRDQPQPGPLGDPERAREVGGRAASLVVGEPEADHPAAGVLAGEPGQRARVQRMPGAVGGDDDRHRQPGLLGRGADRVEDQVGERRDPAEPGGVPARVDLDLQPSAAVVDVVLGGLQHEPAYVALGPQHRPGHVVEPLEAEPALLVGGRQLGRPLGDQLVGQPDAVALGELEQRGVPHRAREVQVQVCLRELAEGPVAQPTSFSAAASRAQIATARVAASTSAGSGKVGASRMLRSFGSSP